MELNVFMKKMTKRLSILSRSEITELYEIPKFSIEQKENYFTLDDVEKQEMESRRSLESRLHFILQLGYFKHSSLFFKFKFHQVSEDVNHIIKNYFPNTKISNDMVSQRTQLDNQSKILKLLKFKLFNQNTKKCMEVHAINSIKINANIRYLFEDLLDYSYQTRTSIPGYSTLQKIISKCTIAIQDF